MSGRTRAAYRETYHPPNARSISLLNANGSGGGNRSFADTRRRDPLAPIPVVRTTPFSELRSLALCGLSRRPPHQRLDDSSVSK